jgi:formylglycine-generating enzyme required for sulfatase activity
MVMDELALGDNETLHIVLVPGGEFSMGSDPAVDNFAQADEQPSHKVLVTEFWIGKYGVTNAQYAQFARAAGIDFSYRDGCERHPVVRITFDEARAFCDWLGQLNKRKVRLPTEAEWEKAARGADGRIYPWGNTWNPAALNSGIGGAGDIAPVDRHAPLGDSPYGASDLSGNVWEWIADWYSPTTYADRVANDFFIVDPKGPASGTHRVLKGGCHYLRQSATRSARRFRYVPAMRCYDIGFRVVVELA